MIRSRLLLIFFMLVTITTLPACGRHANFSFDKSASPTTFAGPGETITYSYVVTSAEDMVTLQVSISDDKLQVNCPSNTVGPKQSITCTATYVTTNEDVAAGVIVNHATASVSYQSSYVNVMGDLSDSATVAFAPPLAPPIQTSAGLDITKTAGASCYSKPNEIIVYTYNVHNVGFTAISGPFAVIDNKIDQWDCDDQGAEGFELGVDEWLTCHGYYKVRETDLGSPIVNVAHVEGFYNNEVVYSNQASAGVEFCGQTTKQHKPGEKPPVIIIPLE